MRGVDDRVWHHRARAVGRERGAPPDGRPLTGIRHRRRAPLGGVPMTPRPQAGARDVGRVERAGRGRGWPEEEPAWAPGTAATETAQGSISAARDRWEE